MLHRTMLGTLLALLITAVSPPAAAAPKSAADEPAPSGLVPPDDEAVIVGSCRVSKEACIDYEGSFPNGEAPARCKKAKGSWREESCPADARVGTCTVRETGTDNRVMTRSYKPATEKSARAQCTKLPRAVYMAH